jgi:hypothetical protein
MPVEIIFLLYVGLFANQPVRLKRKQSMANRYSERIPFQCHQRGWRKKWQISGAGKPPAGICWGARSLYTPAAQPIKTERVPAGTLPGLNAGRYSISSGNAGIVRFSCFTAIMIDKGHILILQIVSQKKVS